MKLLILAVFIGIFPLFAYAQNCPEGSQCVRNETITKAAEVAEKLRAANQVIAAFQNERAVTDTERKAAAALMDGLNHLLKTKDSIISEYERINALYAKVIEFQNQLIDNYEKRLLRGKSPWQKFVAVVEKIGVLLAGIALGRGL